MPQPPLFQRLCMLRLSRPALHPGKQRRLHQRKTCSICLAERHPSPKQQHHLQLTHRNQLNLQQRTMTCWVASAEPLLQPLPVNSSLAAALPTAQQMLT